MFVLVACEESQAVCIELRKLGHIAFSCDIKECSGGHPEWHIIRNCLDLVNGFCSFVTSDGAVHCVSRWDLIIAHPPCTYLSFAGYKYLNISKYGDKAVKRLSDRESAYNFALSIYNADCDHICIENPKGYLNSRFRSPDQTINPFDFGDPFRKRTCLWLKGLPCLIPDYQLPPPAPVYIDRNGKKRYWVDTVSSKDRQAARSKTFPGIARSMAYQFTNNFYLGDNYE